MLKKMSHLDGSFEYPQHKFWFRNKKKIIFNYAHLSGGMRYIIIKGKYRRGLSIYEGPSGITYFKLYL